MKHLNLNANKIAKCSLITILLSSLVSCDELSGVSCKVIVAQNVSTAAVDLKLSGATELDTSKGCVSTTGKDITWKTLIVFRRYIPVFSYTVWIGGAKASRNAAAGSLCGYENDAMTAKLIENLIRPPCYMAKVGESFSSATVAGSYHKYENWGKN